MNPAFADDPLSALALAEAMGGLPRPLNWRKPSWAAAVRLAWTFLASPSRSDTVEFSWMKHRLGPCLASARAYVEDWGLHVTVSTILRTRARDLPRGTWWAGFTTARGHATVEVYAVPYEDPWWDLGPMARRRNASVRKRLARHQVIVDLRAFVKGGPEELSEFLLDLRALVQEVLETEEEEP